jgi:hypothetical protein
VTYVTNDSSTAGSYFALSSSHDFVWICVVCTWARAGVQAIVCIAAPENFDILTEGYLMVVLVEF